jgi:hypothetical protein
MVSVLLPAALQLYCTVPILKYCNSRAAYCACLRGRRGKIAFVFLTSLIFEVICMHLYDEMWLVSLEIFVPFYAWRPLRMPRQFHRTIVKCESVLCALACCACVFACVCMRASVRACVPARAHTVYLRTVPKRACLCLSVLACVSACVRACLRACVHVRLRACAYVCVRVSVHFRV